MSELERATIEAPSLAIEQSQEREKEKEKEKETEKEKEKEKEKDTVPDNHQCIMHFLVTGRPFRAEEYWQTRDHAIIRNLSLFHISLSPLVGVRFQSSKEDQAGPRFITIDQKTPDLHLISAPEYLAFSVASRTESWQQNTVDCYGRRLWVQQDSLHTYRFHGYELMAAWLCGADLDIVQQMEVLVYVHTQRIGAAFVQLYRCFKILGYVVDVRFFHEYVHANVDTYRARGQLIFTTLEKVISEGPTAFLSFVFNHSVNVEVNSFIRQYCSNMLFTNSN